MKSCPDVDALVTPYVDGEVSAAERQAVGDHLAQCPPCDAHERAERSAHDALRAHAEGLTSPAPAALRQRCAASAWAARHRVTGESGRRLPWPLAAAATLVLAVSGVVAYSTWINPTVAAAAQLTLDHLKCFALFEEPAALAPADVQAALKANYGWDVGLPDAGHLDGLSLVGGRRCLYLDGALAHLLYKKGSIPVSVFILPAGERLPGPEVDVLGHAAVSFERGGRTWVVLARQAPGEVRSIARLFEPER